MLNTIVLDRGLLTLNEATSLHIVTVEATGYQDALQKSLGLKEDPTIVGPTNGPSGSRQSTVQGFDDGVVTKNGMAAAWALLDNNFTRLLASKPLAATKAVAVGNVFSLEAFTITLTGEVLA